MLILMYVSPEDKENARNADELARALFEAVKGTYYRQVTDEETYIYEPEENSDFAEELDLVYGDVKPEEIISVAENWNTDRAMDFEKVLNKAEAQVKYATDKETGGARRQWLTCPNSTMYELKKAVMALDGDFYQFAETALLLKNKSYLQTMMTPEGLNAIKANPENYAIIHVSPK